MKRILLLVILFILIGFEGIGQSTFTAVTNGNWDNGATWGNANPGTEGVDWPGLNDNVYTNGFNINVSSGYRAKNIFVEDGSTAISFASGGNLTISGSLVGWVGGEFGFPSDLSSNVFSGNSQLIFTAANYDEANGNVFNNELLASWNETTPITVARFNFSGNYTIDTGFGSGDIRFTQLLLLAGNLSTGFNLSGLKIQQLLQINNGVLNTGVPIYGVTGSESLFSTLQLRNGGQLILANNSSFLNANNISINSNCSLSVGFNGPNQTEGWWYQNNFPSNFNIDANSTINYDANADQNIFAISTGYGHLTVNASNSVTKTIVGEGNLLVKGNFNIESGAVTFTSNNTNPITLQGNISNNGTWTTSQLVTLNGTSNQTINGSNPINFSEELRINKTTGSVTLDLVDQHIHSDLRIQSGTFRPLAQNVVISGNIINDGIIQATSSGIGGFIFNGNTEISSPGGTGITQFRNITINTDATLTSELGEQIDLTTNLINNGIFNSNNGIVNMTGSGTRSIAGSSPLSLYTLNVSGGTINNNNSAVSVTNGITIGASTTFDVDGAGAGNLVLESTSSTDAAYVGIIPSSSSITGNITVERYFNEGRFYRYLGSPVANTTIADWQEEFPITGTFSDPSTGTFDGVPLNSSNPSLFIYDAEVSEYVAYPTSGTAASRPVDNGRGYAPFIRNNTSNIIGAVTGTLMQQEAILPVEFSGNPSESWNLVANPYAAPIDWDATGWTKVNVFDELHVPIAETGGFASYVAGVGSNGGSRYIASGQAFWVRTSAASPTLETVEEIKSVDQSPIFYRDNNPIETFRVKLESPTFSDEIVFALRDSATFAFDPNVDAMRRLNGNDQYTFSSLSEDDFNLKINSIPKINNTDCSITLPLIMESVTGTGTFTFSFEGVDNLVNYYSADIFDSYTGNIVSLHNNDSHTFSVNSDSLSKAPNRFSLILNNRAVNSLGNLDGLSICEDQDASYNLSDLDPVVSYLVYKNDQMVTSVGGEANVSFIIPDSLLSYEPSDLRIYGKIGGCDSSLVGTFKANLVKSVNVETAVTGSEICFGDMGAVSIASESNVSYKFTIDGVIVAEATGNGDQLVEEIPQEYLKTGTNEVFVTAITEGCGEVELNSMATISVNAMPEPEIISNSNILQSSIEGDYYQWFLNGEILNGENNDSLVAKNDGLYELIVAISGCEQISDAYSFTSEITSSEKPLKDQLKLYPNPILDYMNIESNFANLDLKILTLDGKLVKTFKTNKANSKVNMTGFKSGIYYLNVNIPGEGFVTYTIIKR